MTTLEVLIAARALLADPDRWCQGEDAEDAWGCRVQPYDDRCEGVNPDATAFCALGAVDAVRGDYIGISPPENWHGKSPLNIDPAKAALRKAMLALWGTAGTTWTPRTVNSLNDYHATTHADIMAMYERAIDMETPA